MNHDLLRSVRIVVVGLLAGLALGVACGAIADGPSAWIGVGLGLGALAGAGYASVPGSETGLFLATVSPTTAVAMLTLAVSRRVEDPWWQNVLIGTSATALGVLVTVLFVEEVLRRGEQRRRRAKREPAVNRITMEAWLFLSMYSLATGDGAGDPKRMVRTSGPILAVTPEGIAWAKGLAGRAEADLRAMGPLRWPALAHVAAERARGFYQAAVLYADVVEPEEARDVLYVQQMLQSAAEYHQRDVEQHEGDRDAAAGQFAEYHDHIRDAVERCGRLVAIRF